MTWATDPSLYQVLISSSSWMVGLLNTEHVRIQIAFPSAKRFQAHKHQEGLDSYFLVTLQLPSEDQENPFFLPHLTIGNQTSYDWNVLVLRITDLASVWYGKRFDYHGEVGVGNIAMLPDIAPLQITRFSSFNPYNSDIRQDLNIELNLQQLESVLKLLYNPKELSEEFSSRINAFWHASRFYSSAVRLFDREPEIAFIHFVTALEIISSQIKVPRDLLFDKDTLDNLSEIKEKVSESVANTFEKRLYQIRRRVVYTVNHLLNDNFFNKSPADEGYKITKQDLEKRIKAVYDLRSEYVHGGISFGKWFESSHTGKNGEINIGTPLLPGRPPNAKKHTKLEITLAKIPTFTGLERIVRYIILSFAHNYIQPIHEALALQTNE